MATDLELIKRSPDDKWIGKAAVFIAGTKAGADFVPGYWDGSSPLTLKHLCDTEGVVGLDPKESFVYLETPEQTGAGKHKGYVEGEDPLIDIPAYNGDPELAAIMSGSGNAGAGYSRRRPVREHTLVIIPEELLVDPATGKYAKLGYDGAAWKWNDAPLTPEQERLLGLARWVWRGHFIKPKVEFTHDQAGKSVGTAQFQVMLDLTKPEGHMLYTVGDPADAEIDINPAAGG
jgi:hypothetical protein